MGPRSGERGEDHNTYAASQAEIKLQWGPAPESGESRAADRHLGDPVAASMGLRSGERGEGLSAWEFP